MGKKNTNEDILDMVSNINNKFKEKNDYKLSYEVEEKLFLAVKDCLDYWLNLVKNKDTQNISLLREEILKTISNALENTLVNNTSSIISKAYTTKPKLFEIGSNSTDVLYGFPIDCLTVLYLDDIEIIFSTNRIHSMWFNLNIQK